MKDQKSIIKFTKITDLEKPLTKTAQIVDGKIKTFGRTELSRGEFETIICTFEEFPAVINNLNQNQAIVLGINSKGLEKGKIFSQKLWSGEGITRTTKDGGFSWPENKLLYLDFDGKQSILNMEEDLERVLDTVPCLRGKSFFCTSSSGSFLRHEKLGLDKGLSGFHAYFVWDNEVSKLKREIEIYSIKKERIKFVLANGLNPSILVRYPVDMSVFDPGRLVYESGCVLTMSSGITQHRPAPQWLEDDGRWDGNFLSHNEVIKYKSELEDAKRNFGEINNIKELRAKSRESRIKQSKGKLTRDITQRQEDFINRGELPGSWEILMDDDTSVKVWNFLFQPERWHKKTCRDPFEPDYDGGAKNKAIVFCERSAGGETTATVVSHAHGTTSYKVVWDINSIEEVLNMMKKDVIAENMGSKWLSTFGYAPNLDDEERQRLIDKLHDVSGVKTKNDLKQMMAAEERTKSKKDLEDKLNNLNDSFYSAELGGNGAFRIVSSMNEGHGGFEKLKEQSKQDFIDSANTEDFFTGYDAKGQEKIENIRKYWVHWSKRRHYSIVVFDPTKESREWELDDGRKVLNLYKGFAVKPKTGRACGREFGCMNCFLEDFEVCKWDERAGGGVTYWLKHAFDNVAKKNVDHFKWIIDWITDMIRNPGSGNKRPKTSLTVHGEEKGTGKGALIWPAFQLLKGTGAFHTSNTEDLINKFNDHLERVILFWGDEATWWEGDQVSSHLKFLVSEDTLRLEPKGRGVYTSPNYIRVYITSNNERAIPAETGERRHAIFRIGEGRTNDREWFGKFAFSRQDLLGTYLSEFLSYNSYGADIRTIPDTDALRDQQALTSMRKPELAYMAEAISSPEGKLLWDKDGVPKPILVSTMRERFDALDLGKIRKNMTSLSFAVKMGKLCLALGGVRETNGENRILIFPPKDITMVKLRRGYGIRNA